MGLVGHQRIATRHSVPTTPIYWKVAPHRRQLSLNKLVVAEAALIEVSIMGAAIVAPDRGEPMVGRRVEIFFGNVSGMVIVRRAVPFGGSARLILHGVEYAESPSAVGKAIYDHFVPESTGSYWQD